MPINNVSVENKYKPGETLSAWFYCSRFVADHENKFITAEYKGYADKEAAYNGAQPISKFTFSILSTPQSGVPSYDEVMGTNAQLFGGVAVAVDTIAMNYPIFASGSLELPIPPSGV